MSTKVLQLVNSAFFGLSCHVSSPMQAVSLIGVDNIRALVLSVHVFSEFANQLLHDLAFLWTHSCTTAAFAKAIAHSQNSTRNVEDDAFTAGLLHDVGRLVLASTCTAEYKRVLQRAREQPGMVVSASEREAFGCTHAEAGAYLLGLWGLPDSIVEAVAWHHTPSHCQPASFCPLIAVHVADYYEHHARPDCPAGEKEPVDEGLLDNRGLKGQLGEWTRICQELDLHGETHA